MERGAVAALVLSPYPDIGHGVGDERGRAEAGIAGLVRDDAACELELHVAVVEPRPHHAFGQDRAHFIGAIGALQPEPGAGSGKSLEMLVQHEKPARPGGGHVIDRVAPDEAGIEDRHSGVLGRDELAADENASLVQRSLLRGFPTRSPEACRPPDVPGRYLATSAASTRIRFAAFAGISIRFSACRRRFPSRGDALAVGGTAPAPRRPGDAFRSPAMPTAIRWRPANPSPSRCPRPRRRITRRAWCASSAATPTRPVPAYGSGPSRPPLPAATRRGVQPIHNGSWARVAGTAPLDALDSFTVTAAIWPTLPDLARRQGLVSRVDDATGAGFTLEIDEASSLAATLSDGTGTVDPRHRQGTARPRLVPGFPQLRRGRGRNPRRPACSWRPR